jgi:hypothetical protein
MSLLRPSKWTYTTGAGGGASIEFFMASGGEIVLADPQSRPCTFYYGGVGVGIGKSVSLPSIKLPKFTLPKIALPKIAGRSVGSAGSTLDFPSVGAVYMTNSFHGNELTRSDFQGATIYLDGSLSAIYGWAGDVMLLGMNPAMLTLGLSSPAFITFAEQAIMHAPAVLVMRGQTLGFQSGASAGILAGYLH